MEKIFHYSANNNPQENCKQNGLQIPLATQPVYFVLFLREAQAVIYQKHNDFSVWGIELNFPVGVSALGW